MKNTFGDNVSITIFGESHGNAIGCVLDGLSPGIKVDEDFIKHMLTLRRPSGTISTQRQEADHFVIESGVFEGYTTGTPICIVIPNTSQHSKDYSKTRFLARPGHADYTAFQKYHGFEDYRGGGHFSGRVTAAIVAAGAIAMSALASKGIKIGTHISSLAGINDRDFEDYDADIKALSEKTFPVLDGNAEQKMLEKINEARENQDSVGGVLSTVITGLDAGLGEPYFDSIESKIAHAMFAVGGVKGIEFGKGFELANMTGSAANDAFREKDGKVVTETNNNGGINGGITNGMPVTFNLAVKPTPSIYQKQKTVNFKTGENADIEIVGRHDPCIVHRARIVVDSLCALTLCDILEGKHGTYFFSLGEKK